MGPASQLRLSNSENCFQQPFLKTKSHSRIEVLSHPPSSSSTSSPIISPPNLSFPPLNPVWPLRLSSRPPQPHSPNPNPPYSYSIPIPCIIFSIPASLYAIHISFLYFSTPPPPPNLSTTSHFKLLVKFDVLIVCHPILSYPKISCIQTFTFHTLVCSPCSFLSFLSPYS